jgi:hypothetical protein
MDGTGFGAAGFGAAGGGAAGLAAAGLAAAGFLAFALLAGAAFLAAFLAVFLAVFLRADVFLAAFLRPVVRRAALRTLRLAAPARFLAADLRLVFLAPRPARRIAEAAALFIFLKAAAAPELLFLFLDFAMI